MDDEINEILNRPINRQKEIIKMLIEEKINELKVKRKRQKRTESTEVIKNKDS